MPVTPDDEVPLGEEPDDTGPNPTVDFVEHVDNAEFIGTQIIMAWNAISGMDRTFARIVANWGTLRRKFDVYKRQWPESALFAELSEYHDRAYDFACSAEAFQQRMRGIHDSRNDASLIPKIIDAVEVLRRAEHLCPLSPFVEDAYVRIEGAISALKPEICATSFPGILRDVETVYRKKNEKNKGPLTPFGALAHTAQLLANHLRESRVEPSAELDACLNAADALEAFLNVRNAVDWMDEATSCDDLHIADEFALRAELRSDISITPFVSGKTDASPAGKMLRECPSVFHVPGVITRLRRHLRMLLERPDSAGLLPETATPLQPNGQPLPKETD